jgi:Zn-dependent M28 family amino/carboxypeptidase
MQPQAAESEDAHLEARLRRHVDVLAGLIGPRHLGKPKTLEAAIGYLVKEFEIAGHTVEKQPYAVGSQTAVNLVVEIPGSSPQAGIVVLGAHYDSIENTPGADDNASAVAVLIEAARLLHGAKPKRTIRFVAFACEEKPYFETGDMGSQEYARNCRKRGERIAGMLCLEMVGFFTDELGSQRIPPGIPRWLHWVFPKRGDFLAAVGNLRSWRLVWQFRRGFKRATRFPLFPIALPELIQEIRRSDNSSFWDQGYPALMLTDTSFLRNPHYHRPTDTPETLDYGRMVDVTRGVAGAARWLARAK